MPRILTTPWSDERVDRLRGLFADGASAREIAKRIGGVSRNAVISKLARLGLSRTEGGRAASVSLGSSVAAKAQPRKSSPGLRLGPNYSAVEKPQQRPSREAFNPLPGGTHRPWEERTAGQCCWPLDVDGGVHSCCRPAATRGPKKPLRYCEDHERIAVARVIERPRGDFDFRPDKRWAA